MKEYNFDLLKCQVSDVIAYSQSYSNDLINVGPLLETWKVNKQNIINNILNGHIIYEMPDIVEFNLAESERRNMFYDFLDRNEIVDNNRALYSFLLIEEAGFFENKVVKDYICDDGTKIPAGMKLLKAAKYFIPCEELLHEFQDEASVVIQNVKLSGRLCFSVHPLDFLSISENCYNWRSCHALDGDYRGGNLNYMADRVTLICYLRGEEQAILPRFPSNVIWNNKKWRMLLYISEDGDLMFAGKQYPFDNKQILEVIHEQLALLMPNKPPFLGWSNKLINSYIRPNDEENCIADYSNPNSIHYGKTELDADYFVINNRLFDRYELIKDGKNTYHFNDILRSSTYTKPYYARRKWSSIRSPYTIFIGQAVKCLKCGEDDIALSDSIFCKKCEISFGHSDSSEIGYCSECEKKTFLDDTILVVDKFFDYRRVCLDCADERYTQCGRCGSYFVKHFVHENGMCDCCNQQKDIELF